MKKVTREKLIEILKNKSDYTYNDLSTLTGYHPKSLIRINTMLEKGIYDRTNHTKIDVSKKIINDYLSGNYKTYKDFFNRKKYKISYSYLCNILKTIKTNEEIVFIRKIKQKSNYYFEIVDYQKRIALFTYNSDKNDVKSTKNIIFILFKKYGIPKNISFNNYFINVPITIKKLLTKYNVNILPFNSIYRNTFKNLSDLQKEIKYQEAFIDKKDFYNSIVRKTIANNTIQFNNIRYNINIDLLIKKNTKVILYYDNSKKDLFIMYNNFRYKLIPSKKIVSKKGNSKY